MIEIEMEMMEAMLTILRLQTARPWEKMKTVQTTTPPLTLPHQELPDLKADQGKTRKQRRISPGIRERWRS